MNVTFLIGNGFDLRLGLYTKYVDMYGEYISARSEYQVVSKLKDILKKDAPNGYQTWGDFEMAMARHAKAFNTENELVICVRDFKEHMADYLQKEQQKFIDLINKVSTSTLAVEMKYSLENFYKGQTPNVINEIEEVYNPEFIDWNFITFNYTTLLDELLKKYETYFKAPFTNAPLHIHGKLDSDIVLGVDNSLQLGNLPYLLSPRGERAFIKTAFNASFDKRRVSEAEQLIANSDVICIYGMSLGESDQTWISHLRNWLLADANHHLICYQYSKKRFNLWKRDEMMDEEDAQRDYLLLKLFSSDEKSKVVNQVHIPINFDIFNFEKIIKDELEKRPHFVGASGKFTAPK